MEKEEDLRIKIAEILARLAEVIKYYDNRVLYYDQEIKSLHRENAKQSEEIRDAMYLADSLKLKIEILEKILSEKKTDSTECKKNNNEKFKCLEEKLDEANDLIETYSNKKIVTIVNTIITAIISLASIIGLLGGWIKIGN